MAGEFIVEEITVTSWGPWDKHEVYYCTKTSDEVSLVVAVSLKWHTFDCPSLDKVTDPTDEVVLCPWSIMEVVFLLAKEPESEVVWSLVEK